MIGIVFCHDDWNRVQINLQSTERYCSWFCDFQDDQKLNSESSDSKLDGEIQIEK